MDQEMTPIDKITKKIVQDGGLETPSKDFFKNVMQAIEQPEVQSLIDYQPLISKKVWGVLLVGLLTSILVLFVLFPTYSETSLLSKLNWVESYSFSLPEVQLSKTTIYGIGFLSLFLLQIPFLKKQLNNHY